MIEAAAAPCPVYYLYFYLPLSGSEGTTYAQSYNAELSFPGLSLVDTGLV